MTSAATLFLKSRTLSVCWVWPVESALPPPLLQADAQRTTSAVSARAGNARTRIGCRPPARGRRSTAVRLGGCSRDRLEHFVEPDPGGFLVEPLRVHELACEDL